MRKTPASIEHDGTGKDSGERNRRLQKESWPGGQGELTVQEVEEAKERIILIMSELFLVIRAESGPPRSAGSRF
jgi:hypothetical protein